MKIPAFSPRYHRVAFTLIELLVVVAVIAILAGLLFPVMGSISVARVKKVAYSEMAQVQTAIEAYKAKKGTYPPDNPTNVLTNPLYHELSGSVVYLTNATPRQYFYVSLDGTFQASSNGLWLAFGVSGLNNSSPSARGSDDAPAPEAFLKDPRPDQIGTTGSGVNMVRVLACSEGFTKPGNTGLALWRYNSSHPTNNPSTYDLWVDLYIRGQTNRFSNWSKEPQILR